MAETFPTLSIKASVQGWEESRAFDPTIRARSEAGYMKTRARCTRVPKKWKVSYFPATGDDKAAVESLESTVLIGAKQFKWRNHATGTDFWVRLAEPIKYTPLGSKLLWKIEMSIEEV